MDSNRIFHSCATCGFFVSMMMRMTGSVLLVRM
jgi:hypothetical protein